MQTEKVIALFGVANTNRLLAHYESLPKSQLASVALENATLEELMPLLANLIEQTPPKQYDPVIWVSVDSSNIKAIRYDERNEILDIQFLSGEDYFFRYENFPQCEYQQFIEAGSMGSYYARHIKGQFESEKLTMDGE
jgi:hypothetical protein